MDQTSEAVSLAINERTRAYETDSDHHHLLAFHGRIDGTTGKLTSRVVFCRNTRLEWDDQGDGRVNRIIRQIPNEEDTFWGQTIAALRASLAETQPQLVEALSTQRTSLQADPEELSLSKDDIETNSKDWTTLMASSYQDYIRVLWKLDGHGTDTCGIRTASMDSWEIDSLTRQSDTPVQSRYLNGLTRLEPYDNIAEIAESAVSDALSFLTPDTREEMISHNRAKVSHSSMKPALLVKTTVIPRSPTSTDAEDDAPTKDFETPQARILRDLRNDQDWRTIEKGLVDAQIESLRDKLKEGGEFNEEMSNTATAIFSEVRGGLRTFLSTKIPDRTVSDDPLIRRVTPHVYKRSLQPEDTIPLRDYKKKGKRSVPLQGESSSQAQT